MNQLPTRHVTYKSDTLEVSVVVGEATYAMGLHRTLLIQEQAEFTIDVSTPENRAKGLLLSLFYPSMIASVVEQEGFEVWPISRDDFVSLPEALMAEWEQATFELNPHWVPETPEKPEEEDPKVLSISGERAFS